jgi:hypothetical protein
MVGHEGLEGVFDRQRANAVLGWVFVVALCAIAVAALVEGRHLWAGFTFALAGLALVPVVAFRRLDAMLPWEVVALAAVPALGRVIVVGETIRGIPLTGRVTSYVAVAAVALIVAVELDVFTSVRMSHGFAVVFVVVTTVATAGVWAEARWLSDIYLGTELLLDGSPVHEVETALMWDFVAATLAGVIAGVGFDWYFRRGAGPHHRYASDVVAEEGE